MHFEEFDARGVRRNTKQTLDLKVTTLPSGTPLLLKVAIVGGAQEGPLLAVFGGVHGDEYEGPLAIARIFQSLSPGDIKGTFLGIPVCNVPAFESASRTSPVDGLNLARVFPGDPQGSVTERIAHCLTEQVIASADLLIDLHSAGSHYDMPQLCGYWDTPDPPGKLQRQVAEAFGTEVVWAHPSLGPGRSLTAAADRKVASVYTECPGGLRADPDDVLCYTRGVQNSMQVLGMLDGEPPSTRARYHLYGESRVETSLRANASGVLVPQVSVLDRVGIGEVLGLVTDLTGHTLDEIRADSAGYVVFARSLPVIYAGEKAFMVTASLSDKENAL